MDRMWYELTVEGMKIDTFATFHAATQAASRFSGSAVIDCCYVVGTTGEGTYVRYDARTNEQLGAGQL